MRLTLPFLLFLTCLTTTLANIEEPPLPQWNSQNRTPTQNQNPVAQSILLSLESDTATLELPFPPSSSENQTTISEENLVSYEDLDAYFAQRPTGYLVDPQNLLPPLNSAWISSYLAEHAQNSTIDIYLYIFNTGQHIPGDVRDEETVERLYNSENPAIVIFYYLAEPQRANLYLSPLLTEHISAAEQSRGLKNTIVQAIDHSEPFAQLRTFIDQISIRAYWMERTLEKIPPANPATPQNPTAETPTPSPLLPWHSLSQNTRKGIIITAASLITLLTLLAGLKWHKSRKQIHFPPAKTEPRLGAANAAGVNAVISFTKHSPPPAKQRNLLPETVHKS